LTTLALSAVEGWTRLRRPTTAESDAFADVLWTAFCVTLENMVVGDVPQRCHVNAWAKMSKNKVPLSHLEVALVKGTYESTQCKSNREDRRIHIQTIESKEPNPAPGRVPTSLHSEIRSFSLIAAFPVPICSCRSRSLRLLRRISSRTPFWYPECQQWSHRCDEGSNVIN